MSSAIDAATQGERTKYKALVKHMQLQVWAALGKDESTAPESSTIDALAAIAKTNKLTPSRPDRRFPNQNQINTCW
jgi:hypothetical protein